MAEDSTVAIAVLLPDLLGTYSDAGNAVVLARRLAWRGIDARVVPVPSTTAPPRTAEVYLLGGGEDAALDHAAAWLARHHAFTAGLPDRSVTLAVCAGLQLLGRETTDRAGTTRPGPGLLDLVTRPGRVRRLGEAVGTCTIPGVGELTGFHNHAGVSVLGPGATPLARVRRGPANDEGGREEGALTASGPGAARVAPGVVATYLHGPVLARNPALAEYLLVRALGTVLPPLDPDLVPDLPELRRTYLAPTRRRGPSSGWSATLRRRRRRR